MGYKKTQAAKFYFFSSYSPLLSKVKFAWQKGHFLNNFCDFMFKM